jgi:hypothetical protein
MVRLEKNKYMRERMFYKREGHIVLYNEANLKYQTCEDNLHDNLTKQAITILKPDKEIFLTKLKEK